MALRRKRVRRRDLRGESIDDGDNYASASFGASHLLAFAYNPRSICWLDAFLALVTRRQVAPRSARPLVAEATTISSSALNPSLCRH
jgi:hypothetical protein